MLHVLLLPASLSVCVDTPGWINPVANANCIDYVSNGWCSTDSIILKNGMWGLPGIKKECSGNNCALYNNYPALNCCKCGKDTTPYTVKHTGKCIITSVPRRLLAKISTLTECAVACRLVETCHLFALHSNACYDTTLSTSNCEGFGPPQDLNSTSLDLVFTVDRKTISVSPPSFSHVDVFKRKRLPVPTATGGAITGGIMFAITLMLVFNRCKGGRNHTKNADAEK